MEQMLDQVRKGEFIQQQQQQPEENKVEEPLPSNATYFRMASPLFRRLVNIAGLFTEEMTLRVSRDGIRWRTMDPSHISLGDIFIPAQACERFFYESEKPSTYSFQIKEKTGQGYHQPTKTVGLTGILKGVKAHQSIAFDIRPLPPPPKKTAKKEAAEAIEKAKKKAKKEPVEEEPKPETETARIIIENGGERKAYTIHLLETSTSETPLPTSVIPELKNSYAITQARLASVLQDISAIAEVATVEVRENGVYFHGKSDIGVYEKFLDVKEDLNLREVHYDGGARGLYNVEYLQKFLKAVKSEYPLTFSFATKRPCRLQTGLWTHEGQTAAVEYWLAPRLEGEANKDEGPRPEPPAQPAPVEPTQAATGT